MPSRRSTSAPTRILAVAAAIDALAVLVFAALGRRSHDSGAGIDGVLTIAAPFLIGLAIGWLLSPTARRQPRSVRAGVDVWIATLAIGMVLRRSLWDRGTALAFVIVTAVVLATLLLGWRAISALARRRGEIRSPLPPSKAGR